MMVTRKWMKDVYLRGGTKLKRGEIEGEDESELWYALSSFLFLIPCCSSSSPFSSTKFLLCVDLAIMVLSLVYEW